MSKRKSDPKRDALWAEAKRLCRLNAETARMAKELGFNPRTLIKNIPSKSQQWKAPVHVWIRDLYDARQYEMSKRQAASQKQKATTPIDQQSSAQPGSDRAKSATPIDQQSRAQPGSDRAKSATPIDQQSSAQPGSDRAKRKTRRLPRRKRERPDPRSGVPDFKDPGEPLTEVTDKAKHNPKSFDGQRQFKEQAVEAAFPGSTAGLELDDAADEEAIDVFGDTPDRGAFGGTDAVLDSDEAFSSWARSEGFLERDPPVTIRSIQDQDAAMLRHQRNLRKAALAVTKAFQRLPEVDKVVLFGSVASPLEREVPRFRPFRREGVKILHECVDVDLAVWMSDLSRLNQLRKAQARALNELMVKQNIGVAHHQVDVYLMDSATDVYLGRLCHFNECPKGKPECLVPACGSSRFLRQFQNDDFRYSALSKECSETLLDRLSLSAPDQDLPF